MSDTLPKGHGKSKNRNDSKIGISIAIGITAVALAVGLGYGGVIPMLDESSTVTQPASSATVTQPASSATVTQPAPMTSSASYATDQYWLNTPSDRNLIDQLDWSISSGDVMGMYLDKGSSGLIIYTDTVDDTELFVGLNADYIGSDDGTFFILVDNQEHEDYEQAGMDLYIDLPAGAEKVEIIGSYVIL